MILNVGETALAHYFFYIKILMPVLVMPGMITSFKSIVQMKAIFIQNPWDHQHIKIIRDFKDLLKKITWILNRIPILEKRRFCNGSQCLQNLLR